MLYVHNHLYRLIQDRGGGGGGGGGGDEYLCPTNRSVGRDHQNNKTLGWPTQKYLFNVSTDVGEKVTKTESLFPITVDGATAITRGWNRHGGIARKRQHHHHVFI